MRKKIYSFLAALYALLSLSSCEDVIDLKVNNTYPRVVIHGQVVNREGYSQIEVSYTGDFFDATVTPRVSNATVVVSDDKGRTEKFLENPDKKGTYLPAPGFVGEIDRTYTMTVMLEGKEYKSTCKLLPVTKMDSMKARFIRKDSVFGKEEGYYVYGYAKEPRGENFYRWKIYANDSLYNGWNGFMYADDRFLKENIDGVEFPFAFKAGKKVRIETYSLTKEVFNHYVQLFNVINNDGGLFSSPPENAKGNISNGAVGLFSASAVDVAEIVIRE